MTHEHKKILVDIAIVLVAIYVLDVEGYLSPAASASTVTTPSGATLPTQYIQQVLGITGWAAANTQQDAYDVLITGRSGGPVAASSGKVAATSTGGAINSGLTNKSPVFGKGTDTNPLNGGVELF